MAIVIHQWITMRSLRDNNSTLESTINLKVKLTPKNNSSVYTQSMSVPINLGENLIVAHALM